MIRLFLCCLILASLVPSSGHAHNPELAPIRDLYPITSMHLSSFPRTAHTLDEAQTELNSTFLWANTNAIRESYTIDAETRDLRFVLSHGLTDTQQVSIEIPFVYRGGGVLDPAIESWHDFWSLPNGKRGRVEDNSFEITGSTKNGEEFSLTNDGVGPGNIVLNARQEIASELIADTTIAIDAAISLPTSTSSLGHQGVDSALGMLATYNQESWQFHAGVTGLYIGDGEVSNIRYARWRSESFLSAAYSFPSFTVFSSFFYTSRIVTNIAEHPNYSSFLDIGGSIPLSGSADLELAIREEFVSGNGAQDIGLFTGIRYKLQ